MAGGRHCLHGVLPVKKLAPPSTSEVPTGSAAQNIAVN